MDDKTQKDLMNIRGIQFQMTTCPESGGAFNITSHVPIDATAEEIAKELATLREAGFFEMAALNRRKLERSKIVSKTLAERLTSAKKSGDPVKGGRIREAIEEAATAVVEGEVQCFADDQMLLKNSPSLEGN